MIFRSWCYENVKLCGVYVEGNCWSVWHFYTIFVTSERKSTEILTQGSRCSGRHSNQGTPELLFCYLVLIMTNIRKSFVSMSVSKMNRALSYSYRFPQTEALQVRRLFITKSLLKFLSVSLLLLLSFRLSAPSTSWTAHCRLSFFSLSVHSFHLQLQCAMFCNSV